MMVAAMSSNAVNVHTETELEKAYKIETNPGETLFAQTESEVGINSCAESERRHVHHNGASRSGSNKTKELNDLRA